LSGITGIGFFWAKHNRDFATNMHIARGTLFFGASGIAIWMGMWLAAIGFGLFTHL
jgi:hypothetical protein